MSFKWKMPRLRVDGGKEKELKPFGKLLTEES